MANSNNHGGRRQGSGRPSLNNGIIQIRASRQVIETFRNAAAANGLSHGSFLEFLLRDYLSQLV